MEPLELAGNATVNNAKYRLSKIADIPEQIREMKSLKRNFAANNSATYGLPQLIKNWFDDKIDELEGKLTQKQNKPPREPQSFEQYFLPEYRETLPRALKDAFIGKKGKVIRLMIEVLKYKGIVNLVEGEYLGFYNVMKVYFGWDIGSYTGIFQTYQYIPTKNRCLKDYSEVQDIINNALKKGNHL